MLDLDHFKSYNDTYGHAASDAVLRQVGEFLHSRIRAEDVACRYGGEEFVVVLPEVAPPDALCRAEDLRSGLHQLVLHHQSRLLDPITVSIGLVCSSPKLCDAPALLKAADNALYRAKREGRNCVSAACLQPGPDPLSRP